MMDTFSTYGQTNGTFITPSQLQSRSNRHSWQIKSFSPNCQNQSFTKSNDFTMFSAISGLFFRSSPSEIALFIMSIHVNTIKRMFGRWSAPNFSKKFFIRSKTKLYTSPSIVLIIFRCGRFAPFFSSIIRPIFRSIARLARFTVFPSSNAAGISGKTSTRLHTTLSQLSANNVFHSSTVTQTLPLSNRLFVCWTIPRIFQHLQTTKALSLQITDLFIRKIICGKIFIRHWLKITPLIDVSRVVKHSHVFRPAYTLI